jgi:hypothetical protein
VGLFENLQKAQAGGNPEEISAAKHAWETWNSASKKKGESRQSFNLRIGPGLFADSPDTPEDHKKLGEALDHLWKTLSVPDESAETAKKPPLIWKPGFGIPDE